MNTVIFDLTNKNIYKQALDAAAKVIRDGGCVIFPTETVYGLGANALCESAVKKIYEAKGRPGDNPLIVHVSDKDKIEEVAFFPNSGAKLLCARFMPGPITLILKKKKIIPDCISAGLDTLAVRVPSDRYARDFLTVCELPVAAPSANLSGYPSPTMPQHVIKDMAGRVDVILTGGTSLYGLESTVIDMSGEVPVILRPGAVSAEELRALLGEVEISSGTLGKDDIPIAPGMKYRHYQPKAKVVCVIGDIQKSADYINEHIGEYSLACAAVFEEGIPLIELKNPISLGKSANREQAAARLFASLREADERGADVIFIMCTDEEGIGRAYRNRLFKASSEIIKL